MKNSLHFIVLLFVINMFSCTDSDNQGPQIDLQKSRLESLVQTFEICQNHDSPRTLLITESGMFISLRSDNFFYNREKVRGSVFIDVVEIFDRTTMLTTGRHTMADDDLLITGGQFYIRAYQDDKELYYPGFYEVEIPHSLTNSSPDSMQLFEGGDQLFTEETWSIIEDIEGAIGNLNSQDSTDSYKIFMQAFGWFNVDKFYDDPRPKTELDIKVPREFNIGNSIVYLAIKNEENTLGLAGTGSYPIGLEIHLIFTSQTDEDFLYQIISTTVEEGKEYRFETEKMQTATIQELEEAIRALE